MKARIKEETLIAALALVIVSTVSCHLFLPSVGDEGQACFDDKTCKSGFVCSADNVCVKPTGDGGVGSDVGDPSFDGTQDSGGRADAADANEIPDGGTDAGDSGVVLSDAGDTGVVIPDGGPDAGSDAGVPAAACPPWAPSGGGFAACGRMVNSSGDMTGGGFSIRGSVTQGITRTPASGGGFTVR
ncbi:MAG: hypothetical protein HY897_15605 [Deltaproteobacteria bacterium]|nr:hypothetical protein [Deltaproteobacteria bacterium]